MNTMQHSWFMIIFWEYKWGRQAQWLASVKDEEAGVDFINIHTLNVKYFRSTVHKYCKGRIIALKVL